MKTLCADPLPRTECRGRQSALLESSQNLAPCLCAIPPLPDLLHRSLQLLKNRRTFSRSLCKREVRRVVTAYAAAAQNLDSPSPTHGRRVLRSYRERTSTAVRR